MTVLGIDTATRVTAVGVVRDGEVLADIFEPVSAGHAAGLPDQVARALDAAGTDLDHVEGIAVSIGPGSFTGLRVGLSFAKGVAFAARCGVVGVGTFDALAALAPARYTTIATVLDARRGETYLAMFRREGQVLERMAADEALQPAKAVERIVEMLSDRLPAVVLGDGPERYPEEFADLARQRVDMASFSEIHPRGGMVARLGEARLERGEGGLLDGLVPVYVRAAAAEQNLRNVALTTEKLVS